MMTHSENIDTSICGVILQLDGARPAIGLVRRGVQRLVVVDKRLSSIDSRAIVNSPAICACGGSDWWIWADAPFCLRCDPPSVDQRVMIWRQAHTWVQDHGPAVLPGWLDVLLAHDKAWSSIQRLAFASRACELIEMWRDRQEMR